MIVVKIIGGLGNQMFQYAFAKSLSEKGHKVTIDISSFKNYKLHGGYQLDQFNIDLETAPSFYQILAKLKLINYVKEKNLLFDKNLLSINKTSYVKGYFQSEKYFSNIRPTLIHQFKIKKEISLETKKIAQNIGSKTHTCSIHIRRGDYVSNKKNLEIHGSCSLDYYQKAISFILEKFKETHFFIFSDDIPWTQEHLKIENASYVNTNAIPHEDMYLMSLCKNNITANSSFSWWGAWLNQHPNKIVIAPKQWFVSKENEIVCKDWIKL